MEYEDSAVRDSFSVGGLSPPGWSRASSRDRVGPKVRWVALPQLVRDIGPIFGLVSFGVFLSLLVLYIVRAREIRKLRREAPFLAESNGNPEP